MGSGIGKPAGPRQAPSNEGSKPTYANREDTAVEKSMKENWSAGSGLLCQLAQSEEVPWGRER